MSGLEMRPGFKLLVAGFLGFVWSFGVSGDLDAQVKYSPDHQTVADMARKGAAFLDKNFDKDNTGETVLAAIAVVQAQKRYVQEIPKNSPVVVRAIELILKMLAFEPANPLSVEKQAEVYVPAISCILLAEVDKVKYRDQVNRLVKSIEGRMLPHGGINYLGQQKDIGDTSQAQYAALALYVANVHGFTVNPDLAKKLIEWFMNSQQSTGFFHYRLQIQNNQWSPFKDSPKSANPIHTGGLGSVYLMGDMLRLFPRKKAMSKMVSNETFVDLPPTVIAYVPTKDGEKENKFAKDGPVVSVDVGKLTSISQKGNQALESIYTINHPEWNFYYLYALERYAWYREQAEGNLGKGKLVKWYDDGVEFLKPMQKSSGEFANPLFGSENSQIATAFAVLFLVRSSEIISLPGATSTADGEMGFPDGVITVKGSKLIGGGGDNDVSAMLDMLEEEPSEEQLELLAKVLKKSIESFGSVEGKSTGEINGFLREMLASENPYRRLVAVRLLAAEQELSYVPGLIKALSDADFMVCLEAHDGLRLVSRRIDQVKLSEATRTNAPSIDPGPREADMRMEFNKLKQQWSEWYLKIRPNGELLD